MIAHNQSKRIQNAENLLEDLLGDGAELLAMERYAAILSVRFVILLQLQVC